MLLSLFYKTLFHAWYGDREAERHELRAASILLVSSKSTALSGLRVRASSLSSVAIRLMACTRSSSVSAGVFRKNVKSELRI